MYSYEALKKAVELLIKYGMSYKRTMREHGYPKDRCILNLWYKEYSSKGDLRRGPVRRPSYSPEEQQKAIAHYIDHGKNMS